MFVTALVFVIFGFIFSVILNIFKVIGLKNVREFFLKSVFITEETEHREDIPLNNPIIRITIAFVVFGFITSILTSFLGIKNLSLTFVNIIILILFSLYAAYINFYNGGVSYNYSDELPITDGFILRNTSGQQLIISNPERGIFICGGAGSGKSKSIIQPIIQQSARLGLTGVIYDFKFPSLAEEVAGAYAGSGIKQYYVNFTDLERTHRINPIAPRVITNASYAREAAKTILANIDFKASQKRDFWIQSCEALLTSSIWFLRNNYPEYCTLPHVITLILKYEPKMIIELLQTDFQVRPLIASVASGAESENQLAGVFASIQNYLATLATPEIFWVLSGDEVPLNLNDPDNMGILTVGNNPSLTSTLSPVISLIISSAVKQLNQQGKERSIIILDEAPTLFIPNFQQIPATARSNRVSTVYAVQDIAQMYGMMNREESEMIISNLGTQFYGRTTNTSTAERVSSIFGKHEVEFTSQSKSYSYGDSDSTSVSKSTSFQQRDRLMASQVLNFQPGEFAGINAEGNFKEFRDTFLSEPSQSIKLYKIREIKASTESNYKDINKDIESINL